MHPLVLQTSRSSRVEKMKSVLFGWMLGLGLLASHFGCCSVRMVGNGFGPGACGDADCSDCGGVSAFGSLRTRVADRIRSTNCGSGCGEIYWDEQINEPPVCDPCGCDGQYQCGACGSCPSVLGRLRSLWGYRYMPSSCDECSSCGTGSTHSGSGSCSTCASNSYAEPTMSTYGHTTSSHVASPVSKQSPTPAAKPRAMRETNVVPEPIPDSNAMFEPNETPRERMVVGSGVSVGTRTTAASPVSANTKRMVQSKPRLVTNPR